MSGTYRLDVDYETADLLFKRILKDDYKGVVNSITSLRNQDALDANDKTDLDFYISIRDAMQTLMSYYFNEEDRDAIIKGVDF